MVEVSDRKEAEEALQQAHETLELRVAERTAELRDANVQLQAEISSRQQVEDTLRQSNVHFQALIENNEDIICVIDAEGVINYYSPSVERVLGYCPEEVIGKDVSSVLHPDDVDHLRAAIATLMNNPGNTCRVEYRSRHRDGSLHHFEAMASSPSEGLLLGDIVVNARDITERKRAEAEHQRLEIQLRQSQKMEAVGTLAGGIAHDFNNVLGAIFIHTEVAKTIIQPNSSARDNLRNVILAAGRAKRLIQQILMFSRQVDMQRQPIQLTSVIQDTLALLRASLPTTIEIRQSVPEKGDTILADSTQVHQILLNLCVNAEHAMREKGGVLEINVALVELDDTLAHSHPDLQPGSHVRLIIRDSGHGIAPEVMERIFDPFFTTKGVGEGTGMGLAMVHGIVTRHGGAITVESTPGTGTTFTLYFPSIEESVDEHTQLQSTIPQGAGCIMLVDDEPMLVMGMKALLTRFGYEVAAYTSSQEALFAFEVDPTYFDLVVTDQTMPQLTGEELTRELRQRRPDIPIILCTGFSHVINGETAREQGIDAYCIKPLDVGELTATIQKVLEERSVPAVPPEETNSTH